MPSVLYITHLLQRRRQAADVVLVPALFKDAPNHVSHGAPGVAHLALRRRHALEVQRKEDETNSKGNEANEQHPTRAAL